MSHLDTTEPLAVSDSLRQRVQRDYERFATAGLPSALEQYLLDEYGLDMTAEHAGFRLKNPWGKASGQLSMTARQVEEDVAAGLGFVVLKTVIAQDEQGGQSMSAWAIPEARMVAEPIVGQSGEAGWTITWKGRGWWQPFEDYLQLIRDARRIASGTGTLIIPSCKYHLPSPDEPEWRIAEYDFTTAKLLEAWQASESPMPLEKDFSPTLAGSDRAAAQAKILEWLRFVPKLVRDSAARSGLGEVRIGMKLFNALFDDDFQLEMLNAIHGETDRPDFFIYANRLFDPNREFDGHRGVAYGGPDLSDRNLRVLDRWQQKRTRGVSERSKNRSQDGGLERSPSLTLRVGLPWSATGNITTGRMAVEYLLRGATSFQLHTFFQLPAEHYAMKSGNRTQRALHELYFHPQTGFVVWLHHMAKQKGICDRPIRFLEIARG